MEKKKTEAAIQKAVADLEATQKLTEEQSAACERLLAQKLTGNEKAAQAFKEAEQTKK